MQQESKKQSLNNILVSLSRVYPDLAVQFALSGLSLNENKMLDQIDCLLAVASIRSLKSSSKYQEK